MHLAPPHNSKAFKALVSCCAAGSRAVRCAPGQAPTATDTPPAHLLQRIVAVGLGVHDDPDCTDIVDILQGVPLEAHLLVHAPQVLGSACQLHVEHACKVWVWSECAIHSGSRACLMASNTNNTRACLQNGRDSRLWPDHACRAGGAACLECAGMPTQPSKLPHVA